MHRALPSFLATQSYMSDRRLFIIRDALRKMARYKAILGEDYAAKAYANAADIIIDDATLEKVLRGSSSSTSSIRGIGKGITAFVASMVAHGHVPEMEEMRTDPRIIAAETLEEVIGIGPVAAMKFVAEGCRSVADVAARDDLSSLQRIGVSVYGKVMKRVPRAIVEEVFRDVATCMLPNSHVVEGDDGDVLSDRRDVSVPDDGNTITTLITGSYRRGSRDSGDVDILIVIPDGIIIPARYLAVPKGSIILTAGEMKMSYLYDRHADGHKSDAEQYVQVDIFVASRSMYIPYLLYSTGSADHNVYIRGLAKSKGYHLTQYALTKDNVVVPLKDEKALYDILGVGYVPPEKR